MKKWYCIEVVNVNTTKSMGVVKLGSKEFFDTVLESYEKPSHFGNKNFEIRKWTEKGFKVKSKAVANQFYNVERVGNSVCSTNPLTGEILKDFKPGRTKFAFGYVNPVSEWTEGIKADFECALSLYLSYTRGHRDVSQYETLTELAMEIEETRELFEEYIHNFVEEGIVMEYMKYSMKRARFLK